MASTIKVDKIAQASGTPEFTVPTADGTAKSALITDGSGVLYFATGTPSSSNFLRGDGTWQTVTTTALTGSTNTWIPTITGANALTGTANFTYDGSILDVKNSGTASSVKLYCESSNAHAQEIKAAPHASSSSWTLTLPGAVPTVSGQALTATTAGVSSWSTIAAGKFASYACIGDQVAASTPMQTITSGAWRTRNINIEITDPDGIVSIASNQFTLAAGSYILRVSMEVTKGTGHSTRIYDITNSAVMQYGGAGYMDTGNNEESWAPVIARVTPAASTVYEVQQIVTATATPGSSSSHSVQMYLFCEIFKEN